MLVEVVMVVVESNNEQEKKKKLKVVRISGEEDKENVIYTPESVNALHDLIRMVVVQYMYCTK